MKPRRGDDLRSGDTVTGSDVIEHVGVPFTLAPGHPMRRLRCLLCAMRVGGRFVRIAIIADCRGLGCACGAIPSTAYLICAEHGDDPQADIARPAMARYDQHHRPRR